MDSVISLSNGVTVTPLLRIAHQDGYLAHILKSNESSFCGFGEAYFTTVHQGHCKGWKKHNKMTLNLVVPVGDVTFYLYDINELKTKYITLGESNYARLTVPPGLCMAFSGSGSGLNMVLNIASVSHNPQEAETYPLSTFPLSGDSCENIAHRC
jgi:dTDP-4-dehydrorhamnose 3,5-epimerase